MPTLRSGYRWSLELKKDLFPFLLGFLATSFQIIVLREFEVRFYGNELVYGFVLAFWLLGGSLGSLLAEKKFFRAINPGWFYAVVILIFTVLLIILRFSRFFIGVLPAEMIGPGPVLLTSWLIAFLISLPLGVLFVYNVFWLKGSLMAVYQLESLGAAAGGLLVYLLLVPLFSSWQAGAIIIGLAGIMLSFLADRNKALITVISFILAIGLWNFDWPAEKIYWKPFQLIAAKDSPYARLQVVGSAEQVSFYSNSSLAFNFPDPAAAEEAIHFAVLQRPGAKKLLLIGGGLNGALDQVLQYPEIIVDYVELDPALIDLARKVLAGRLTCLDDPRVTVHLQDGRKFLQQTTDRYDLIICNLPEPVTAQVNRFYTVDFFSVTKEKLTPDGVLSFLLPSSENYLSDERTQLLASILSSLKSIFQEVEIVPGDNNIFLASNNQLDISSPSLLEKLTYLNLETVYFRPELLQSRLHPFKKEYLRSRLQSVSQPRLNSDRAPISYFYQTLIWSQQFPGAGSQVLGSLNRLKNPFWLFDFPVMLFLALIIFLSLGREKTGAVLMLPVAVMGFTTLVAEVGLILTFQSRLGLVYSKISLLFTMFMFGLFLGSTLARARFSALSLKHLTAVQGGFVILLAVARLSLRAASEPVFYSLLLIMGMLGGFLFVVSNAIYLNQKTRYGLGYSLDLFGSFLGALLATSIFIPILGLELLFNLLLVINSFCLGFIMIRTYLIKQPY